MRWNKKNISIFVLSVMIFTLLITSYLNEIKYEKRINVIFRFDDYSARSSESIELNIINAFRMHHLKMSVGVIPFVVEGDNKDISKQNLLPLTIKKKKILRDGVKEGILDVALHGYSHQTVNSKYIMEFATLDYEAQLNRLELGRSYLESVIGAPVTAYGFRSSVESL